MGLRLVTEIREGEQVPQTEWRKMCRKSTSPVATNYGWVRKWMVGDSCNDSTRDSVALRRKRDSVFGLITRRRWGSITRYNLVGAA